MEYRLIISGRMPGLNDYTSANRANPHVGAKMKKQEQERICRHIYQQLPLVRIRKPVWLSYCFYEPNKRRDHDNVSSFAHKVIQDALVACKVLVDDGWSEVLGDDNKFFVDKSNPRIEVTIREV